MESVEHVQPDMWHRSAIQTAEMRQSPVSLHVMLISFCMEHLNDPCCKSTGKKCAAELCRGDKRFLVHKQQGPGQSPTVGSVEVA